MSLTLYILSAVLIDRCLGEPKRFHPLVGFGTWANFLEQRLWHANTSRFEGLIALILAVFPITLLVYGLDRIIHADALIHPVILYFCIGAKSLKQHSERVFAALDRYDIVQARQQVAMIVSRETVNMGALAVRRAAIESVLENGADAIFAPLFWFIVAGPAGAVFYRLVNTLDAVWGYKNERYNRFGWAAARLDDGLNYLPARLTACSYALLGQTRKALRSWHRYSALLESPNAGPVMSSGAGTLNIKLGGPAIYHGQLKNKPYFGGTNEPADQDIIKANRLIDKTLWLWIVLITSGEALAGTWG
ncbi:MAG: adenosylcobinamide-phosphate synthase CbiB [Methylicorpusculum sp.]|uniref:adenosylcobinamide-phosphate synthase CbiB n=1 Tax=Methylicorpusculum sp. TaxID=2713644 RepID=UPI002722D80A|nr:adenosylcobinamide-phosphate synthase CbiB [Methylicorpusculum sp.]MDO8846650.1 adenosylcobinamide-phosphate synthase CbiB [Methylicorpusculum sp.]MDO8940279.1 adenosylcobinamide-phosphate synthase CbiB [Methylicorpusculum sp.]MDP2200765.1 adenosylcobinamide-phosphate synthase CbiB [Methylicorpusculum sp.]